MLRLCLYNTIPKGGERFILAYSHISGYDLYLINSKSKPDTIASLNFTNYEERRWYWYYIIKLYYIN